ncbi:type-4 uracil-DNA glycosylase [Geoglobus acetivorans]|uniref:Type-4 uracil-DNA glycosylase n=1 Tax=Geoglobus acetivorans TaxID=565033 RepID=A0ABZ3GZY6_GEOAI|nr:uracil-DNA glycosylase [Geoglobus acetivorans]
MKSELESLIDEIKSCRKCTLHLTKKNYVPGEGNENAQIMFIGEAPGREEDEQGRPFVGNAGKLLTALIERKLGLARKDVYIANILKCRPPNNRDPMEHEVDACFPYLLRQIEIIKPDVIVCLGRHSAKTIFEHFEIPFRNISRDRGKVHVKNTDFGKISFVATYHPAAALYKPAYREIIESDFEKISGLIKRKNLTLSDFISD